MGISLLQFPAMGRETEAEELIQDSIQVYNAKYQEEKVVDKGYLVRKGVLNSTESTEWMKKSLVPWMFANPEVQCINKFVQCCHREIA